MIELNTQKPSSLILNLDGPSGNAMAVVGMAKNLSSQIGFDGEAIAQEMMSQGSYEDLIKVFDKHFGCIVRIETSDENLYRQLAAA